MRNVLEGHIAQTADAAQSAAVQLGASQAAPSIRSSGLFGSKLALWGTLSLLALGYFGFLSANRWFAAARAPEDSSQAQLAAGPAAMSREGRLLQPSAAVSALSSNGAQAPVSSMPTADATATTPPRHGTVLPSSGVSTPQPRAAVVAAASAGEGSAQDSQQSARTPGGTSTAHAKAAQLRAAPSKSVSEDGRTQSLQRNAALEARASEPDARHGRQETAPLAEPEPKPTDRTLGASDQLRIEAELLDAARRALGQGALWQARRSLDRYAQQFEHGILRPESDVLRIELQMRGGEPEAAKARASRFLSAYPNHPLRERVRALIATR
jgi:hypothetical protein